MFRWKFSWLAVLLLAGVTSVATADEALDPGRLDPSLKGLPFGAPREEVVKFLKARVASRYDALIRNTMDVRDQDRLMREKDAAVAATGADVVVFDGKSAGWDVSVIRDEFFESHGEEMVHVRDGEVRLYFFFAKNVLYKLVRSGSGDTIDQELAALENAYGAPPKKEGHLRKEDGLKSATWAQGNLTMRLDDRRQMYQCATVRWAVKSADEALQAEWAKLRASKQAMNPLIHEAQVATPERDEVDPVDALLGPQQPLPQVTDKPAKGKKKAPKK